MITKYKEIIVFLLSSTLAFLSFSYEQPFLLSTSLFLITMISLIILGKLEKFFAIQKVTFYTSLFFCFVLSTLVAISSSSFPNRSEFIIIFSPIVTFSFIIFSDKVMLLTLELSKYIINRPVNRRTDKYLRKLLIHTFLISTELIFFISSYFMLAFLPLTLRKFMSDTNSIYLLLTNSLEGIAPILPVFLLFGFVFVRAIHHDNRALYGNLKKWTTFILISIISMAITVLSFMTPILLYAPLTSFYGISVENEISYSYMICKLNNTAYSFSSINPYSSFCQEHVSYENNTQTIEKYFVYPPKNQTYGTFELPASNITLQYYVLCGGFQSFLRNIGSC